MLSLLYLKGAYLPPRSRGYVMLLAIANNPEVSVAYHHGSFFLLHVTEQCSSLDARLLLATPCAPAPSQSPLLVGRRTGE